MFRSFFMAGFECATGYNSQNHWIDQIAATGHDRYLYEDYRRLKRIGIRTIREGVRWPLVDTGKGYDLAALLDVIAASEQGGMEVIYDLFHYGYPAGVDLFSDEFPARFAAYCYEVARCVAANSPGPYYFTPINEPSYFSWAAAESGKFAPHLIGRGWELKQHLAAAAIKGIEAIWAACPTARIVNADPMCRTVAPLDDPGLEPEVVNFNDNSVFQSWDIICGRLLPELGGSREHLDIVGINYYWTNQWEFGAPEFPLADDDPRRERLSELVKTVYERYGGDIVITETSHVGDMRPVWYRELADEAQILLEAKVPLQGICIYPVLGMPEWHEQSEWTCMGLWDVRQRGEELVRVPCRSAIEELAVAQARLEGFVPARARVA